ncbi:MAG: hypothetical protein WC718_11515 [Phycisphaerales bacterium]|jgi:BMFP domain-containing protein YqiC
MSRDHHDALTQQIQHVEAQLRTLQESVAFAEHADEALKSQLVDVDRALRALAHRVVAIEARLAGLAHPGEADLRDDDQDHAAS